MSTFDHSSGEHLALDDARIYYETSGAPSGDPLVLLHGGVGSMADFNGILPKLPWQFRLIGIDLRGQGRSTLGTMPLNYERYQTDVEAVLTHLGIEAAHFLGYSDGGIVAYRIAAQTPARVKTIIAVGSHWRMEREDPAVPILSGVTSTKWQAHFPESVAHYESVNPEPDFDTMIRAVVDVWMDTQASGYPGETVCSIDAPILMIRGDEDPLFSAHEAAELSDRIEDCHFLNIPFAGHAAHEDAPNEFISFVNPFLLKYTNDPPAAASMP